MARPKVNGSASGLADPEIEDGVPVTVEHDGSISPGDDETGIPTVEPASIAVEPSEIEGTRRRGRPKGSRNVAGKPATKEVSADLTSILVSLHWMGSVILSTPELQLSEDEGKKLGAAVARVNAEYGNIILPPKTAAWINLAMVGGAIYGPRVIAMKNNAKKKKAGETQPQPAQHVM